ncbi:MAG: RdgB/HAM1 family non-canonical purine NTP pyrophosphatase [Pseudomonadota bacterium]
MSPEITLVFATRNKGKLVELRQLFGDLNLLEVELVGLGDLARPVPDVVEDGATFAENAVKKATEVANATGLPAVADDSGLEVDALGGEPGVRSARYAGDSATDEENNQKLLARLAGIPRDRRSARFRCVVAFAVPSRLGDRVITAEGSCEGTVLEFPRGHGGFGYDPLFYAPELAATFAEAGVGPKGGVSHRARAVRALLPAVKELLCDLAKRSRTR